MIAFDVQILHVKGHGWGFIPKIKIMNIFIKLGKIDSFVFEPWTWTFTNSKVPNRSWTFHGRFRPFETFLRPEKLRNDEERSDIFILYMINVPKRFPNHDHDHASRSKKLFDRNVSNLLIANNSWPIKRNLPVNLYMLEKLKRNF